MNEHSHLKEETLFLMREIGDDPSVNQRLLAKRLNISLGKTNYLIKELAKKGAIKIASFSKNPDKTKKLRYVLTHKGIEDKIELTFHFLKAKEKDYKRLKEEYEQIKPLSAQQEKGPDAGREKADQ